MRKLADSIRRVGIIANVEKAGCGPLISKARQLLTRHRLEVLCDEETAAFSGLRLPSVPSLAQLAKVADLLLVVGGDGTMLRVARGVAGLRAPILGINVGNLGFLTAVPPRHLLPALKQLLKGQFALEERAMLEGHLEPGFRDASHQLALNDFVLSRGQTSRLIELEVRVNDELLTRYRCDGLIVSSPTGSTAYSLAAGGGVVSPDAEVITLTPICPHTLSIRPVIISLKSTVRVRLVSPRLVATLAADGQQQTEVKSGDTVVIRRSVRSIRLVRLDGNSFFSTLRQKFGWSGSNV